MACIQQISLTMGHKKIYFAKKYDLESQSIPTSLVKITTTYIPTLTVVGMRSYI